jgi:hypothetical protein
VQYMGTADTTQNNESNGSASCRVVDLSGSQPRMGGFYISLH